MNGKLCFTVAIVSLSFNVFSSDEAFIKSAQGDYVAAVDSMINNQINYTYNSHKAGFAIAEKCESYAPKFFLEKYKLLWQSTLHTPINDSMFLTKDLQQFKRIAIFSCVEGAFHTQNGKGNEFIATAKNQISSQKTKVINDAYQQSRIFELEAGLSVSEYGFSLINKKKK